MSRWLTAGMAAAVVVMLAVAAIWSSAPPAARAQTAPDVRLREPAPTPTPAVGQSAGPTPLTLRISSATLEEDRETLANGVDLTLLAQPTYVALPSAGPNLLRISPAITITARDASGRPTRLSDAARLRFRQLGRGAGQRVPAGRRDLWRPVRGSHPRPGVGGAAGHAGHVRRICRAPAGLAAATRRPGGRGAERRADCGGGRSGSAALT